jgi:hypothetical protein
MVQRLAQPFVPQIPACFLMSCSFDERSPSQKQLHTHLAVARRVPAQGVEVALIRKASVAVHDERHMARHRLLRAQQQQREEARKQRAHTHGGAAGA